MEFADVLARFGASYRRRFGVALPRPHARAMGAIEACRTAVLGGQVVACDGCGVTDYVYHSCGHRACPKCGRPRTTKWLEARRKELLPVPYFHVVFTVPAPLRRVVRKHQRVLYGVLMRAAAQSLMELAADPRFVGGRVAVMAVLHTWARTLAYHPHVHCLVPAGGLSRDGTWRPVQRGWLVPGRALAKKFRGRFVALARKAVPNLQLPPSIFRTPWVVHLEAPRRGTETVLRYLGRYVHRVALTNARLVAINAATQQIVFRYRDKSRRRWRTMRLHGHEFLRRFLQHVLAPGFHKVRYYGLWSPANKRTLLALRQRLLQEQGAPAPTGRADTSAAEPISAVPSWRRCRECGGVLQTIHTIPRGGAVSARGPP